MLLKKIVLIPIRNLNALRTGRTIPPQVLITQFVATGKWKSYHLLKSSLTARRIPTTTRTGRPGIYSR